MKLSLKDSRGRESITLTFVAAAYTALLVKFVLAGATLPLFGAVPAMGAVDFGIAVASVLTIWVGREWVGRRAEA